jgi:hypothetical protein
MDFKDVIEAVGKVRLYKPVIPLEHDSMKWQVISIEIRLDGDRRAVPGKDFCRVAPGFTAVQI